MQFITKVAFTLLRFILSLVSQANFNEVRLPETERQTKILTLETGTKIGSKANVGRS